MSMHKDAEHFAEYFTEPIRSSILEALRLTPPHLVPHILASSQSSWILVDSIPGPKFAIWRETGKIYVIGEDGAVNDEPIQAETHIIVDLPEGYLWYCEDCADQDELWVTDDTRYANFHSDAHGHSLALFPISRL